MTKPDHSPYALRVADLAQSRPTPFDITLKAAELDILRDELQLLDLKKLRFQGELRPLGKRDWELSGNLGATVEQPCVATLAPVRSRVETSVTRRFLSDFEMSDDPESEMPDDDETEPLTSHIDPGTILKEALSLALPLYPRADDADAVHMQVTEPGKTAMTDDDAKPFAGLAELRESLTKDD